MNDVATAAMDARPSNEGSTFLHGLGDRSAVAGRLNARVAGEGDRTMMFAHGFGCDQNMWRFVAPAFEQNFRTLVFDYVGAGGSDLSAYDAERYGWCCQT